MSPYPKTQAQMEHARDNAALGFYQLPEPRQRPGRSARLRLSAAGLPARLPNDKLEERRRNLVGFVAGATVTAKMIDNVLYLRSAPQGIEFFFFGPHGRGG